VPPPPPSGNKAEADGVDGEGGGEGVLQRAIPPAPDLPFFCKAPSALCEEKEHQHTTKGEGGVAPREIGGVEP
jgi:hypothetical protein